MQLRSLKDALGKIAPEPPALWRAWRLVGELDLLLAAGGGQIDDEWGRAFGQPYTYLRWALLARLRGRPFAVASVGVSKLRHWPSERLFRWSLGMADYVSCRDGTSAAALSALLKGRDVPVVYDLAIGLRDVVDVPARGAGDDMHVVLSPMSFGKKGIWPTEAEQVYDRYIGVLTGFVARKTARGIPVTLVTSSGDDANAVRDLVDRLRASFPDSLELVTIVRPARLEELSRCLADATIVVASRLHGVILSHMLERPVIALSFDPKVDRQMQQFGQTDLLTSIRSFTLQELEALFDDAAERRDDIRARIHERAGAFRDDVGAQYDTLAALAKRHAGIS
jgi:polysaccharide pyruvyl transferase WcaK-like protein